MSLSFLGKKSFHPSNPRNLKKLFQAEEQKEAETKKAEELKPDSAQPGLGTVSGSLSDASAGRNDVTSAQPPGGPAEGKAVEAA